MLSIRLKDIGRCRCGSSSQIGWKTTNTYIYIYIYKDFKAPRWTCVSGWWFQPFWKYISQLGSLFPTYGKIKHVPNHQPVSIFSSQLRCWFKHVQTNNSIDHDENCTKIKAPTFVLTVPRAIPGDGTIMYNLCTSICCILALEIFKQPESAKCSEV